MTYGRVVRRVFAAMDRPRADAASAEERDGAPADVVAGFRARLAGEVADLRARISEVTAQRDELRRAVAAGAGLLSVRRAPRWKHVAEALGYEAEAARALCAQSCYSPDANVGGMPAGAVDDAESCESARAILGARPGETVAAAAIRVLDEKRADLEGLRSGRGARKLGIYRSGDGLVVAGRSFDHVRRLAADYSVSGGWIRVGDDVEVKMRNRAGCVVGVRVGELRSAKELEPGVLFVPDDDETEATTEVTGR